VQQDFGRLPTLAIFGKWCRLCQRFCNAYSTRMTAKMVRIQRSIIKVVYDLLANLDTINGQEDQVVAS
jgi:hypothetical protein